MAWRAPYLSVCTEVRMKTQEEKRAQWREMYARQYPPGFKRRRNAEQTAKQLIAQRRYQQQEGIIQMRKLQRQVRHYLKGGQPRDANIGRMVGCTPQELQAHLDATMSGANVLKWNLTYRRHPREFDLDREEDRAACFHFSNMYARPVRLHHASSFQCPSRLAPPPEDSSHAVHTMSV